MVAGEDERGRKVRTGLLGGPDPLASHAAPSRPQVLLAAALLLAVALTLAPARAGAASEQRTGRLLVTLKDGARSAPVLALPGLRRDGAQVPQIGLVSVRPTGGVLPSVLAPLLRRLPGVRHVEVERRHELRAVPNDPSLTTLETAPGTPAGTPLQWWISRLNLPAAWDIERGAGATVAVIDSGVDAGQPDLAGKIAQSIDNDDDPAHGPPTGDENGHGSHVSSQACAAGDNGTGIVGAGLDCRLLVIKSDLGDGSIARSIVQAADLGADAVNMSFGTNGTGSAARAIVEADRLRRRQGHAARRRRRRPPRRAAGRPRQPAAADRHRRRHRRRPRPDRDRRGLLRPPRAVRRARDADLARRPGLVRSDDRPGRPDRRVSRQPDRARGRHRRPAARAPAASAARSSAATIATPTCRARRWRRRS